MVRQSTAKDRADLPDGQDAPQRALAPRQKPSALVDTRVIYGGDNLEQLKKLPDACVDLSYISSFPVIIPLTR